MIIRDEKCDAINERVRWAGGNCEIYPNDNEDSMWVEVETTNEDIKVLVDDAYELYLSLDKMFKAIDIITGVRF